MKKLIPQIKKGYAHILPVEFRNNWYRYVRSSWKRLAILVLLMFIPFVNFVILLMSVPRLWGKRAQGIFFMDKASSKDVYSAFFFLIGLTVLNYTLYVIAYNLFIK